MREYARVQTAVLLRRLAYEVNHAAKSGDADSVHDLRVAIRRFSRCLRTFDQFYPRHVGKRCRRELSELLGAAGEVRDRDIALEMIAKAGISARASIVTRLRAERMKASHDLLAEVRRWSHSDFSRKWRNALELES